MIREIEYKRLVPDSAAPVALCKQCEQLDFWAGGFFFEASPADLRDKSKDCKFCEMLWLICVKTKATEQARVRFEREQSTLRMAGGPPLPVLSIFRSPELEPPIPIQLGLPWLPEARTDAFFKFMAACLKDCDENHRDCLGKPPIVLPTRLIDVGTKAMPVLRLLETAEHQPEDSRYIALSHPWGPKAHHPPYSTLREDPSGRGRELNRLKQAIPFEELPATFKDAVTTVRALGVRYLWIDSICIIQGSGGDFKEEASRMSDVFSHAYCIIAASRAAGQHSGFLGEQAKPSYLTFTDKTKGHPFYMCESIDNFGEDALSSPMNKRGWVFQEHALARRTIFFTTTQIYFECGRGVRCQTLTKMHNNVADFLGDPHFPEKALLQRSKALKIRHFQDLYKKYSRLEFSYWHDRPFGIAGLEACLRTAYSMPICYGIFDDGPSGGFFHRSLLWRRAESESEGREGEEKNNTMTPISFADKPGTAVPSWSWMAYRGAIDYLDLPFRETEYEKRDISPPWTRGAPAVAGASSADTTHQYDEVDLVARVRDYNVAGRSRTDDVRFFYDAEKTRSDGQKPQCVVIAKSKTGRTVAEKTHYVLIVTATVRTVAAGDKVYARLGVGYMPGKYIIGLETEGIRARIY